MPRVGGIGIGFGRLLGRFKGNGMVDPAGGGIGLVGDPGLETGK